MMTLLEDPASTVQLQVTAASTLGSWRRSTTLRQMKPQCRLQHLPWSGLSVHRAPTAHRECVWKHDSEAVRHSKEVEAETTSP